MSLLLSLHTTYIPHTYVIYQPVPLRKVLHSHNHAFIRICVISKSLEGRILKAFRWFIIKSAHLTPPRETRLHHITVFKGKKPNHQISPARPFQAMKCLDVIRPSPQDTSREEVQKNNPYSLLNPSDEKTSAESGATTVTGHVEHQSMDVDICLRLP